MSVADITRSAAWMVALAVVAMVTTGWRRKARATAASARRPIFVRPIVGAELEELRPDLYDGTSWMQRLRAVTGGVVMAVALGAVLATIVGFGAAWTIITLSDKLVR